MDSLRDRWRMFRNRTIASPAFRRWAARFPLTRPVARRSAGALFDLMAGFVYSQVLLACVRTGLLDRLAQGPCSAADLARATRLPEAGAARLARAASALGLVEQDRQDRFSLGLLGAAFLANPSLKTFVEHHAILYRDLADPVPLLKGEAEQTGLASFWAYARASDPQGVSPGQVAAYSALMAQSQAFVAEEVLDAVPLRSATHLLDVGGGEGAFAEAAARRWPHLSVTVFDLPAVAARAEARFAAAGLTARAKAAGGSFLTQPLPAGADVATLVRVLHDHDDGAALTLLRAIHRALPRGGHLMIAEPMAETAGAERAGDAYFGFYLLAMGSGRPRSANDIAALAREAGFRAVRPLPTATPLLVRVLRATA